MAPLCTCSGRAWCNFCFWTKSVGYTPEGGENALRNLVASLKPVVAKYPTPDGCWIVVTREQSQLGWRAIPASAWIEVVWPIQ